MNASDDAGDVKVTLRSILASDPEALHAFELARGPFYGDDPVPGEHESYARLHDIGTAKLEDARTLFAMMPHTSGSDYSGGALQRANAKVLRELLDSIEENEGRPLSSEVSGGHGTFAIVLYLDVEASRESWGALVDMAKGLQNYPCADDDALSELEHEEESEAWENYGRADFSKLLAKRLDAASGGSDWIDGIEGDPGDLFFRANDDGALVTHEESTSPYLDVDKASARTDALHVLLAADKLDVDFRAIVEVLAGSSAHRAGDEDLAAAHGVLRVVRLHRVLADTVTHVAAKLEQSDKARGASRSETTDADGYRYRARRLLLDSLQLAPAPANYSDRDKRASHDAAVFSPVSPEWAENEEGSAVDVLARDRAGTVHALKIRTTKKGAELSLPWQWGHEEFAKIFGL